MSMHVKHHSVDAQCTQLQRHESVLSPLPSLRWTSIPCKPGRRRVVCWSSKGGERKRLLPQPPLKVLVSASIYLYQPGGGDHVLDACHVEVIPQLIFRRRCCSGSKRPFSAVFVRVSPPVPPPRHTWTRPRKVKMSSFSDAQRPGCSSAHFTILFRVVLCGDLYRGLPTLRSRARSYSRADSRHAIPEVYRCKTGGSRPS